MSALTMDWLIFIMGCVIVALAVLLDKALCRAKRLKSANATLVSQVATLQAHPDSWQSGYNEGRRMGSKHGQADIKRLNSGMIIITGRDEFGEPTRTHARGLNLRKLIDEAIEEHKL